jgi:hypothetical protein
MASLNTDLEPPARPALARPARGRPGRQLFSGMDFAKSVCYTFETQEDLGPVTQLSRVSVLLGLEIAAVSLLLSCGLSHPPQRLTVHVAPRFTGTVHISTCVQSAPNADLTADEQGVAATSACPSSDEAVELVVLRGDQSYKIAAEDVSIMRTGDGIPTTIQAEIRF